MLEPRASVGDLALQGAADRRRQARSRGGHGSLRLHGLRLRLFLERAQLLQLQLYYLQPLAGLAERRGVLKCEGQRPAEAEASVIVRAPAEVRQQKQRKCVAQN